MFNVFIFTCLASCTHCTLTCYCHLVVLLSSTGSLEGISKMFCKCATALALCLLALFSFLCFLQVVGIVTWWLHTSLSMHRLPLSVSMWHVSVVAVLPLIWGGYSRDIGSMTAVNIVRVALLDQTKGLACAAFCSHNGQANGYGKPTRRTGKQEHYYLL